MECVSLFIHASIDFTRARRRTIRADDSYKSNGFYVQFSVIKLIVIIKFYCNKYTSPIPHPEIPYRTHRHKWMSKGGAMRGECLVYMYGIIHCHQVANKCVLGWVRVCMLALRLHFMRVISLMSLLIVFVFHFSPNMTATSEFWLRIAHMCVVCTVFWMCVVWAGLSSCYILISCD